MWYHHIISVKLNLSPHAIWCEIPKNQHKNNPTEANTQNIPLKVFQLLETFMATSRCVYFKSLFFPPSLIPTCDNPRYSQKFLQHHRDTCKRRSKLDREHWSESSADMLKRKLHCFIPKVKEGSNHTVQVVQIHELRGQQHCFYQLLLAGKLLKGDVIVCFY